MTAACRPARRLRWGLLPALAAAVLFAAGCTTPRGGREGESRRALRSIPMIPEGYLRADRALVAAFFSANGIPLSIPEAEEIIPASAAQGRLDRNATRTVAAKYGSVLTVIRADEATLWEALGRNLTLLVLLPPDIHYNPSVLPLIPVAWDRAQGTLDLLEGNGEIQTVPAELFFARRQPLKQAALCLVRPHGLRQFQPAREQTLLLADFWFEKGFYRHAAAAYAGIQETGELGTNVAALVGQGNVLVRQERCAQAIPYYRAALLLEPDNPQILNNLAFALLEGGGELLTALRHATKAAQLEPENPFYLETLGSINLRLGDAVAAAKYFEHAWARALKLPPEIQVPILDQLVRAWLAADRTDLAWQVAQARQRNFPQYRFPKDILAYFPALKKTPADAAKKNIKN